MGCRRRWGEEREVMIIRVMPLCMLFCHITPSLFFVSVMLFSLLSVPFFCDCVVGLWNSLSVVALYFGMFSLLVFTAFCACYDAFVFIIEACA